MLLSLGKETIEYTNIFSVIVPFCLLFCLHFLPVGSGHLCLWVPNVSELNQSFYFLFFFPHWCVSMGVNYRENGQEAKKPLFFVLKLKLWLYVYMVFTKRREGGLSAGTFTLLFSYKEKLGLKMIQALTYHVFSGFFQPYVNSKLKKIILL